MISPPGPTGSSCLIPPPNLLPIPALDGGRLVFLVIEAIRGKRVSEDKEGMVHFIGLIALFALIIFLTYNDIMTLIRG